MGCSKTYRNWECLNFFQPFSGTWPTFETTLTQPRISYFHFKYFFCNLDHFHFCEQDNQEYPIFILNIFFWNLLYFQLCERDKQEYLIFISNIFSGTCSTSSCVSETTKNILFSFQIFFLELAPLPVVWARQPRISYFHSKYFFWNLLHFQLCERDKIATQMQSLVLIIDE